MHSLFENETFHSNRSNIQARKVNKKGFIDAIEAMIKAKLLNLMCNVSLNVRW